jgi:hypothetical protein
MLAHGVSRGNVIKPDKLRSSERKQNSRKVGMNILKDCAVTDTCQLPELVASECSGGTFENSPAF